MNQPTALSAAIADAYDLSDEWSDLCDLPPNIDDWTASSDRYADYVVYVDESGDDALPKSKYEREQLKYPYFVLAFCIFEKDSYVRRTQPAINCLKHLLFGGDEEILHEREARKGGGIFSVLSHDTAKGCFMTALTRVIEQSDLTIISVVIRKDQIQDSDPLMDEKDVYSFAMKVGLERLYEFMRSKGQERKPCRVICESRDKYQDRMVRATMRSVIDGQNVHGCRLPFVPVMIPKASNSVGLQIADLVARPIGLYVGEPNAHNRTYPILEKKLWHSGTERPGDYPRGLVVFPGE